MPPNIVPSFRFIPRRRALIAIPSLLVGGTEVHTLALATALRSGGFDVSVCCYHEHDAMMLRSFADRGIPVDVLNVPRSRIFGAGSLLLEFSRILKLRRPDIVHIQYMAPGAIPVAIARASGVRRVVATVHVTASHYGRHRWIPRHFASPICDAFLCVSKTAEASFFGGRGSLFDEAAWRGGRRHFTIHNCVPQQAASGSLPATDIAFVRNGGPLIGIVGRLDYYKGHDVLLDAMVRITHRVPGARLVCVGDGEKRDALVRQAHRLGISASVIWLGRVPPAEVSAHMRQMDIVAMPSRPGLEGFGLAAAEAMAHGKPVVASNVDALAEILGSEDPGGLLVPPNDSEALAAAIEELLGNPSQRSALGAAGRRRVSQYFSTENFTDRHLRLYASLCASIN